MNDKKNKVTYEKCRQEIAKKYKSEIEELKSEVKSLRLKNIELDEKVRAYENEIITMKDWLERMQEYTNMSQDDLDNILKNERNKKEFTDMFDSIFKGPFGAILNSYSKFY